MAVFYKTTNPDRYALLKDYARENRNNPTLAEAVLWNCLKGKSLGYKFRRQQALLDFIADFVCLEKKLVVEVDGEYHFTEQQQQEDRDRTERLTDKGFRVVRFRNEEVLNTPVVVIEKIKDYLTE